MVKITKNNYSINRIDNNEVLSKKITELELTLDQIEKGDYVIFPENLQCIWEIHKSIRKHYTFK